MPRIIPEPRYFSTPSTVVGAATLRKEALNCNAVDAVVSPGDARLHELAGRNGRSMAEHSNQITLTARLDAKHAKPVLLIVEGHPFDKAGQDLCGRVRRRSLEHAHER